METKICDIVAKNGNLAALKNEDVLKIDLTVIEVPIAMAEVGRCLTHLQINGNPIEDTNLTMDSIQYNAFDKLFIEATSLRGILPQRYVTGLRVHLGIKNFKIVLLFQPTCLIKSSNPTEPNRYYASDGIYYTYDDNGEKFVPALPEDMTYITNYQSLIKIKHFGNNIYEGIDRLTDTKSIVIPFQVIFSLIYDNNQNSDVFLFNAMVSGTDKINHSVIMGTAKDSNVVSIHNEYTGKYANRSHLCPPCSYVDTLDVVRQGTTCQ